MMFFVAQPHEYLAITGSGIPTVKITKKAWVWPLQRVHKFSVQPQDYAMSLQAMTKEKLQFLLPCVFTIGPDVNARGANATAARPSSNQPQDNSRREDKGDSLMKFAMLLADADNNNGKNAGNAKSSHVENIVKGVIEGETRVLVSSMTMEEIFTEREEFKRRIFHNIQSELDQFGLKIYNANVKELKDAAGSTYFQSLSQKAHEGATQTARVDVSEARLRGTVGEAERIGLQDQRIAKINADTAVLKTQREVEEATAKSKLATEKTELDRALRLAKIQAQRSTEAQDEELKQTVEQKRAAAELERLRATDVVQAAVKREARQHAADAAAYETRKLAEARLEQSQKEAEAQAYATRCQAEAERDAAYMHAEAELQRRRQEAEALKETALAFKELSVPLGGPQGVLQYLMLERGTYGELARANADAVRGMEPKVSVWNTGSGSGEGGSGAQSGMGQLSNIYQTLPPLMTTINEQTGIRLPEWQFGSMGPAPVVTEEEKRRAEKQGQVNGH